MPQVEICPLASQFKYTQDGMDGQTDGHSIDTAQGDHFSGKPGDIREFGSY